MCVVSLEILFIVRHAAMAVAFHRGADYNSVLDVDAIGSMPMAFTTAGDLSVSGVAHSHPRFSGSSGFPSGRTEQALQAPI